MKIPPGMTEQEVFNDIHYVANKFKHKYTLGYYDKDDIYQECFILAMEGLEFFKSGNNLRNFLTVHVHNRFLNEIRKKVCRNDSPCTLCARAYSENGNGPHDGEFCKRFIDWKKLNNRKANLMTPGEIALDMASIDSSQDKDEIFAIIDQKISIGLRQSYLKMKSGVKIPKAKRDAVLKEIQEILSVDYDKN